MKNGFYLAIDIGASKIRLGIIDNFGDVHSAKTISTNTEDPEKSLEMIEAEINALRSRFNILACGIGCPGPLDLKTGKILDTPNLNKWNGLNIIDEIRKMARLKIFLDRDSHNALRGERWLGELRGATEGIMLTWGSGVGGSVMMNGRIYYGPGGMAGELGHIIVDADGPECNLGHRGCLESFIGGKAVEKKYNESLADICQKARDKQSAAIKITDGITKYLNQALETYIQIFNPQKIVIGGAVSRSLPLFLNNRTNSRIVASSLGSDAGFFGSALLAMERR